MNNKPLSQLNRLQAAAGVAALNLLNLGGEVPDGDTVSSASRTCRSACGGASRICQSACGAGESGIAVWRGVVRCAQISRVRLMVILKSQTA
jgi:hypothetical protein